MSKVIEHIEVRVSGKEYPNFKPLNYVDAEQQYFSIKYSNYVEYRVIATFGASIRVGPEELKSVTSEQILKAKVYRPLAEEIFGEYRMPLLEADRAAYEGDFRKVSEIIHKVLDSMFKV